MDPDYKKRLNSLGVHFGINEKHSFHSKVNKDNSLDYIKQENSLGEFTFKEQYFDLNYQHGDICFDQSFFSTSLIKLPDKDSLVSISDCLFLDTETTGLSTSGGTFAFMIGVGYFNQTQFILRQYFLWDPNEEAAMLLDLENIIENHLHLVSYNGVSFDTPILKSRYKYHRMPSSIIKINQIDLLKYARMLFRYQFDNRSLKSIEANVLKFHRSEEEIPGFLAPIIYQEYLKTKNTESIDGVFYHNAMDIVSLAAFISIINQISAHQGNYFNDFETIHFSLAKQFERTKYLNEAINTYKLALAQSILPERIKINCYLSLAKMYKKFNQIDIAINFWQQASIYGNMEACIELAKVYEHIIKKYDLAINCCKRALFILENDVDLIYKDKLENEIMYRLSRLRIKANR